MSADFFSGLLLLGVVLFGAVYLVKEFFWESLSGAMAAMPRHRSPPPREPNDHLVGAVGRVVDDGTTSGNLRVRVGMESWRARAAEGAAPLPVGTEVEVKAVDGRVLDVAPRTVPAEQPGSESHSG